MLEDKPRSLRDPSERETRKDRLDDPRIQPLTAQVRRIREEKQEEIKPEDIPYFDPLDGGIQARCLFLLQDPGPKAVKSCFISRNNDDPTAENFFRLNEKAGLDRKLTVSWNIVPWRVRDVGDQEIQQGIPYLRCLLQHLQNLEVIVLVGQKAQSWRVVNAISLRADGRCARLVFMSHLSQRVSNRWPEKEAEILDVLRRVTELLDQQRRTT